MRTILFILILFVGQQLFSQDTTVTWLNNIDTSAFIVQYTKKEIPTELYLIIGIENADEMANPNKPYQKGCVGPDSIPRKRLNWIAQDKNQHWILSISYGGRASGTKFYFIDIVNGKLNTNIFHFKDANPKNMSLGIVTSKLKARQFTRDFETKDKR